MRFSVAAAVTLSSLAGSLAKTVNITVGDNNSLLFNPESVADVQQGDVLQFTFVSKNHSVVQSTFATPCTAKESGINSDFHLISDPSQPFVWNLTVNDTTAPLWFYCSQKQPGDHCAAGMVLAINPTANATFDAFKAKATGNSTNGTNTNGTSGSGTNGTSGNNGNNGALSHTAGMTAFGVLSAVGVAFGLVL
ncbi:Cupredoxin [Marasmius fiardii PR-910]|nr:Cupredoxin [Marasmius fiardii PR-910]